MKMFTTFFFLLFDIIELQIKSFHYRTANEKLSNANENYRMQMKLIQSIWKCSLRSFFFAVRYHRTANKKFSLSNCKWKIIQCKWELSHANENYRMQMKMFTTLFLFAVRYHRTANKKFSLSNCKWKIIQCKWELVYRMQMKIIQCKWKIIACKWKVIECKWIRSNIATFHMPYETVIIYLTVGFSMNYTHKLQFGLNTLQRQQYIYIYFIPIRSYQIHFISCILSMNITWVSEIVNIVVFLQSPDWVKMLHVRGHERGKARKIHYINKHKSYWYCFRKAYFCTKCIVVISYDLVAFAS